MWLRAAFLLILIIAVTANTTCSDTNILSAYSSCLEDFEKTVSRLTMEEDVKTKEAKCLNTTITALKCIQGVLQICHGDDSWSYNVQQLLNFRRARDAFTFACEHTLDIAAGLFCQAKHLKSDIIPCIEKKVVAKQNAEQSQSTDVLDKKSFWRRVCNEIIDGLNCVRDEMAESCPKTSIVYSGYRDMLFSRECYTADENATTTKSEINKATAVNSVSVKITVLVANIVYFKLSNLY